MKKNRSWLLALPAALVLLLLSWLAFGQSFSVSVETLDNPEPQASALFGRLAAIGDVDGDGVSDIAVSASAKRKIFIFSGADAHALLLTINAPITSGGVTHAAALGDVNGDGVPDLAAGAPLQDVAECYVQGQAFIFSGADGTVIHTIDDPLPQGGARFGGAIGAVGDVDGDGVVDVGVGAHFQTGTYESEGKAFVFSGATGALVRTIHHPFPQYDALFGTAIKGVGDVDGDGVADIAVGAQAQDIGTNTDQGQAYVYSGTDGALLYSLSDPDPQASGLVHFGIGLAGLGDVNGVGDVNRDGVPDVAVAATGQTVAGVARQGRVYVFSGDDASLLLTLDNPNPQADSDFGSGIARYDLSDGTPVIAVGAQLQDVGGNTDQGVLYLFSVRLTDTTPPTLNLPPSVTLEATGPGGAVHSYSVSANDDIDPEPVVQCTPASGSTFPLGTTPVNCSATDASGNSSAGSFTVTVRDTTPPLLQLPADFVVEGNTTGGANVTLPPVTATDVYDPAPWAGCDFSDGFYPLGYHYNYCWAYDSSINVAEGSYGFTVIDTTPPDLAVPGDMTIEGNTAGGALVTLPAATATDLVDPSPTVTCDHSSGFFPLGDTAVHCSAADGSLNVAPATYTVTVVDTAAPTANILRVVAPQYGWLNSETVTSFPQKVGAPAVSVVVHATDVVGVGSVTVNGQPATGGPPVWAASDVALNEGNNAVTAQVTDLGGNSTEVGKTLVFQADLDQDGSHNNVDRKPRFPSADFSDQFTTGLGREPIQLAVTPNGERVYVAAFASGLVSVLDTATSQVSTNIPVGGNPFGVAISPDGARAYGIRSQGMEINFLRSMRDPGHGRRSEP